MKPKTLTVDVLRRPRDGTLPDVVVRTFRANVRWDGESPYAVLFDENGITARHQPLYPYVTRNGWFYVERDAPTVDVYGATAHDRTALATQGIAWMD